MDRSVFLVTGLIILFGSLSGATSINTDSIETSNITSTESQLSIGSVTNFTDNALTNVNNLFFSSTAYIVQESNGDDMVFQLDDSGGTRNNFLRFDISAMSTDLSVPVDMGSNQINNLADPTEPQDAATMNWVNDNDDFEPDTVWSLTGSYLVNSSGSLALDESVLNSTIDDRDQFEANTDASTKCGSGEVLTGSGCVSQYTSSTDGDSAVGNEGVNGLSFDTGNGVLTLGREHRSSLTQDLDGRYATSDTNTQLDDQPAESNVDMSGYSIDNAVIPSMEAHGKSRNHIGVLGDSFYQADDKWTCSGDCSNAMFDGKMGSRANYGSSSTPVVTNITFNGGVEHYWGKLRVHFNWGRSTDHFIVRRKEDTDQDHDCSDESWSTLHEITNDPGKEWIGDAGGSWSCGFSFVFYRENSNLNYDNDFRVGEIVGYQYYNGRPGPYLTKEGGTMYGNVDMNGKNINNAGSINAQNSFQLPVGTDAY